MRNDAGFVIDSSEGRVDGIPINSAKHTVSAYTDEEIAAIVATAKSLGDIIIAEWGEIPEIRVFIYLGDSILLSISSADGVCCYKMISDNELKNIPVTLLAYDRYAILRPFMK